MLGSPLLSGIPSALSYFRTCRLQRKFPQEGSGTCSDPCSGTNLEKAAGFLRGVLCLLCVCCSCCSTGSFLMASLWSAACSGAAAKPREASPVLHAGRAGSGALEHSLPCQVSSGNRMDQKIRFPSLTLKPSLCVPKEKSCLHLAAGSTHPSEQLSQSSIPYQPLGLVHFSFLEKLPTGLEGEIPPPAISR